MGSYRVDHKLPSNLDFQAVEIRFPFQFSRFHHPSQPDISVPQISIGTTHPSHEHPFGALTQVSTRLQQLGSRSGVVRENAPTTWVPMATATMACEERKAAACGCIGRAEAPRRPPEWRRSRCCTVVHSIGAPDLDCSGIRGLFGCHPQPNLPDRRPSLPVPHPCVRPPDRRPSAAESRCEATFSGRDLCSGGAGGLGVDGIWGWETERTDWKWCGNIPISA
jgi:hypothetical protein